MKLVGIKRKRLHFLEYGYRDGNQSLKAAVFGYLGEWKSAST